MLSHQTLLDVHTYVFSYLGGEGPDRTRSGVGKVDLSRILLHGEHNLFETLLRDPHPPIGVERAVCVF